MIARTSRKLFSDTAAYAIAQLMLGLRGLLVLPVFARQSGPEGYGVYAQVAITVTLMSGLLTLRLDTAAVRFLAGKPIDRHFRAGYYSAFFVILAGGSLVIALIYPFQRTLSTWLFASPEYGPIVVTTGIWMLGNVAIRYLVNFFRITERLKHVALVTLIVATLETVALLTPVWIGYGIGTALWTIAAVDATIALALLVLVMSRVGRPTLAGHELGGYLRFGLPLLPNNVMIWAVNYADRLLITHFLGVAAVGLYAAPYAFGRVLGLLVGPVTYVAFPMLVRLWSEDQPDEVRRLLQHVTRYYLLLALPAVAGLTILGRDLLAVVATSAFDVPTELIFWIVLGIGLNGLYKISVYVFHLQNATVYVTLALLGGMVLNVVLNFILIPLLGLVGAALATAATGLFLASITMRWSARLLGVRIPWWDVGRALIAASVMVVAVLVIRSGIQSWIGPPGLPSLVGLSAAGAMTYLAMVTLLRVVTPAEQRRLLQLARTAIPGGRTAS